MENGDQVKNRCALPFSKNFKTTQFQAFICEPLNLFKKKNLSTAKIEIHKLFIKNIFQIKFTGKIKISIIYLHCNSLSFMHKHIRFWSIPIYLKLENYKSLNADFMTIVNFMCMQ